LKEQLKDDFKRNPAADSRCFTVKTITPSVPEINTEKIRKMKEIK